MSSIKSWQDSLRCSESPSKGHRKRSIYSKSETNHSSKVPAPIVEPPVIPQRSQLVLDAIKAELTEVAKRDMAQNELAETMPASCLVDELQELDSAEHLVTYMKAFALIYVLPEEEWTVSNIDKLLAEGEELFHVCTDEDAADGLRQRTVAFSSEGQHIKRSFKLDGNDFTLELRPPYLGEINKPADQRPLHIMRNLRTILGSFFRTAHYCLLLHKAGYLLIWRRHNQFFLMDIKQDYACATPGVDMLATRPNLDAVVQLIGQLSDAKANDAFNIRELAVVRLLTPDGRIFMRDPQPPTPTYNVINDNYAYLRSNLHLSLNPNATLRNCSSIVVGVACILAASIDHPTSWNTCLFDRLICYGVELYRSCWAANLKQRTPIDLAKFPTQLRLGQFVADIQLLPKVSSARWHCALRLQGTDFEFELQKALENYGNALFQINNQMYALWSKDNFYYLLDPYRHIVISPQTNQAGTRRAKCATVRMFRTLPTMLSVFHQLLNESNLQSTFLIHGLRIKNIAECPPEVVSMTTLNLPLNIPQGPSNCRKLLAEISDYEPSTLSKTEDTTNFKQLLEAVKQRTKADKKEQPPHFGLNDVEVEIVKPSTSKLDNYNRSLQQETRPKGKSLAVRKNAKQTQPLGTANNVNQLPSNRSNPKPTAKKQLAAKKIIDTAASPRQKKDTIVAVQSHANEAETAARKKVKSQKDIRVLRLDAGNCSPSSCIQHGLLKPDNCSRCPGVKLTANRQRNATVQTRLGRNGIQAGAPTTYPVFTKYPYNLAVAGSESGTMESLNRLLDSAFKVTNRVLTITPWGNYVVFRLPERGPVSPNPNRYYIFDGCTCNIDRFRHLDLSCGTAGLLGFQNQTQVVCFMIDSRETKAAKLLQPRLDMQSSQVFESCLSRGT